MLHHKMFIIADILVTPKLLFKWPINPENAVSVYATL